jgi:hypothetical protein
MGIASIKAWYGQFINQILPNATFALTSHSGMGSSRHLTWTAKSKRGNVLNGNDTFGLTSAGKITYHYTFFTVMH